ASDDVHQTSVLIKFFKQEIIELDATASHQLIDAIDKNDVKLSIFKNLSTVHFSDKSILYRDMDPQPRQCSLPDFVLTKLVKKFPDGQEKLYSILAAFP